MINELLSERYIKKYGIFNNDTVSLFLKKIKNKRIKSAREEMAALGIVSTQLINYLFVEDAYHAFSFCA
jgi:hypothetical protein